MRLKLRNMVLKSGSNDDIKRYTKQRNLRVSLPRKTQKNYYRIIDGKKMLQKILMNDNEVLKTLHDFFFLKYY